MASERKRSLWMMLSVVAFVLFIAGCLGDAALPVVSTTRIPGTDISIQLGGPSRTGQYCYYVFINDTLTYRDLGPLRPDQTVPATLKEVGDGVVRIQWGDGSTYAIIDTKKEIVVEDSNSANPKNQPFAKRPK